MRRHGALDPYVRMRIAARLMAPVRRRRFHSFGHDSFVHRPAFLFRPWQMAIGSDTWVQRGAWLEIGEPAWEAAEPVIRIGDNVAIRHHVTISAAERVVIEDNVLIAAWVSIFDSDHTMAEPDHNPVWNPQETAPVRIGRGSWLGERVTVLRGADIGEGCVIGAHSVVRGHIPDHSLAVGAPARVVRSLR